MRAIWELPQNIIGRIVLRATKAEYMISLYDANVFKWNKKSGVSLGEYIFVPDTASDTYIKHEYGHTVQSRYLGWFYLLIIGLPSLIWAGCFKGFRKKHGIDYYTFYTEKWADKLGGVERRADNERN